ncbi:unnamed protein product, partial [Owenia fusiformis]
ANRGAPTETPIARNPHAASVAPSSSAVHESIGDKSPGSKGTIHSTPIARNPHAASVAPSSSAVSESTGTVSGARPKTTVKKTKTPRPKRSRTVKKMDSFVYDFSSDSDFEEATPRSQNK